MMSFGDGIEDSILLKKANALNKQCPVTVRKHAPNSEVRLITRVCGRPKSLLVYALRDSYMLAILLYQVIPIGACYV